MNKLFDKNRSLFRNPGAKIICLLISIGIWFFVMDNINPQTSRTFHDVPITILGTDSLDKEGIIIQDSSSKTVTVDVQGNWKDVMSYDRSKMEVTVSVSGFSTGEADIPIRVLTNDARVSVKDLDASSVHFVFDEIQKTKKQVRIVTKGELAEGLELGNTDALESEVEIEGPSSIIRNVAYLEAVIDIAGKEQSFTEHIQLIPKGAEGETIDGITILEPIFDVRVPVIMTKNVTVNVKVQNELDSSLRLTKMEYEPKEVTIRGDSAILNELTSVNTEEIKLNSPENSTVTVSIATADNYTVVSNPEVKVNFFIEALEMKRFEYGSSSIAFNGKNNNLNYSIKEGSSSVVVEFTGIRSDLTAINRADIKLSVNVEKLEAGSYRLPVIITTNHSTDRTISPEYIEVEIN